MIERFADALNDLSQAFRALARAPTFTAVAVGLLALGVGATTAVLGAAWTVVWQPLPLPEPDRLVWANLQGRDGSTAASPRLFLHWRDASSTLDGLAAVTDGAVTLAGDAATSTWPERVAVLSASADFFDVLGAPMALGHGFQATEDHPAAAPTVVLSHRLWQRRFAGDPGMIGRTIELDGRPHRVVGVLGTTAGTLLPAADLILPLRLGESQRENRAGYLALIGRLRDSTSIARATDELDRLIRALDPDSERPASGRIVPLADSFYGDLQPRLNVLIAAVLGVAAIGCGNLAILLLARGTARARELGLRRALGAGRGRIARLMVIEGLVLGSAGALAGALIAYAAIDVMKHLALPVAGGLIPRLADARIDSVALGAAMALGLATAVIASLAPIWRASQVDPRSALAAGRGATGSRDRLRSTWIAAEVALSLLLLVTAGLVGRSLLALQAVDSGFRPDRVLTAQLALPRDTYPTMADATAAYERVVERLAALPGVESAAVVSRAPFSGGSAGLDFTLEGHSFDPAVGQAVQSRIRLVRSGSFAVLGVPILAGRDLAATDTAAHERVVVINRMLARRLGAEPGAEDRLLGRRIVSNGRAFVDADDTPMPWRVVGIVGDIRDLGPRTPPEPAVHFALAQVPPAPFDWIGRQLVLVLRTEVPPESLVADVRRAVMSVDPALPINDVRSLEAGLATTLAAERILVALLAALGAIGMLLSAAGLYALVAYLVGRRRREIGIRMALGASLAQVRRLILDHGMRPVLIGLGLGLVASVGAGRLAESVLYGVSPHDPWALIGACGLLVGTALAACWIPSGAAARVDPASVLDSE